MRTIITLAAAFIALASPAQAQSIRTENNGGGYITLTDRVCTIGDEVYRNLRVAIATGPAGTTRNGCGTILRDTVVLTLDAPDEGRYPITAVETRDGDREIAVKITYRNSRGDEKVLDFLADKDPTTALRFRAHSGLVWVKAE